MSHELRTPLNSLLILAKLLTEDAGGNLTTKQIDYARTIYGAGSDLLALINDILDLSKVEAGKMQLHPSWMNVRAVVDDLVHTFTPTAEQKGLDLKVEFAADVPARILTDEQRLQQVLRNLLSNALKFTEVGGVHVVIARPPAGTEYTSEHLASAPQRVVAFSVTDTGIGVDPEKLKVIFEAFQQADGTTSRRYGGTGLGLSISREISGLLRGELRVTSTPGAGSTFSLFVPEDADFGGDGEVVTGTVTPWAEVTRDRPDGPRDDRDRLLPEDPRLLVVADRATRELAVAVAHDNGFKVLFANDAGGVLEAANRYAPDVIVLSPGGGPSVLTTLHELKRRTTTRHLPTHVSIPDADWRHARDAGAARRLTSPITAEQLEAVLQDARAQRDQPVHTLLVLAPDERRRHDIIGSIGGEHVEIISARERDEAKRLLGERAIDCIALDLLDAGQDGLAFLEEIAGDPDLQDHPVVLTHLLASLAPAPREQVGKVARAVTIVETENVEQLLDATALFLHRPVHSRAGETRRPIQATRPDPVLTARKVLIVDDDVRNVFAVSAALEAQGMSVRFADNGRDGIAQLEQNPDVDLVLMDIMMPEMDGYETMRAIRRQPAFTTLPIIALTAKALTGDRESAIEAGASDYVTKPVDIDKLLAVIREWLTRTHRPAE
jgi:CheY-like chemotaxis protein